MIGESIFFEIAAILCLATLLAIVGQKLRQPLIIMFLATGILAGPSVLGIVQSYDQIELLAQIGIALLLFIVGLKLDLQLIRTTGPVALATGFGQIVFTSAIGLLIAVGLGMTLISAAYIAVALTFSSTIIIVKLLSDKKEIDSLPGNIESLLPAVSRTEHGRKRENHSSLAHEGFEGFARGVAVFVKIGQVSPIFLVDPVGHPERNQLFAEVVLHFFEQCLTAVFHGVSSPECCDCGPASVYGSNCPFLKL